MIPRNYIMFKGFVRRSIGIPWILTPVRNKVLHDKAFQIIKDGNIISNQKNLTGISMKSEMRYTSTFLNTVTTKSIMESIDEKPTPLLPEKQEDIFETDNNQILSEPVKPIQKRKRKSDVLIESEILEIPKPATSQLIQSASKRILRRPDFEIVDHFKQNGIDPTQTLIVPISKDDPNGEIRCRTYYYDALKKQFVCSRCSSQKKYVPAKVMVKDDEEVVELSNADHICEPVLYEKVMEKLNPDYIEKRNFEIKVDGTTKNLRIFTNINRSNGYEYYYNSRDNIFYCKTCKYEHDEYVPAKLIKRDGREVMRMNKHFCEPIDLTEVIVKEPDYAKLKNNQIFVFSSKERQMGYKYFYDKHKDCYLCCGCKTKNRIVSATSAIDENKNECFKLSKSQHVCRPIKYQCDISKIEQPDLIWAKEKEGIEELENLMTKMREIHPFGTHPLTAKTYVITSAPPESSPERKASCILYVGYSEDLATRLKGHMKDNKIVHQLIKKYGVIYFIPIFQDIPSACSDLEAMIYDLWNCGSLNFQLCNLQKCSWKSNNNAGGLRSIAENPDHPEHQSLVLAVKKLIVTNIADAEMTPSRKVKRRSRYLS